MTPEAKEAWLAKVRRAAMRRDNAASLYSRRLAVVRSLIRDASAAGVPMTEIAKAANVARSRAHRLRSRAGPPVE